MLKKGNMPKSMENYSLLYELVVAAGSSREVSEACQLFIKSLVGKGRFAYGAVWVKDRIGKGPGSADLRAASLVYSFPKQYSRLDSLPTGHPLFTKGNRDHYLTGSPLEKSYSSLFHRGLLDQGRLAIYPLKDFGVLVLVTADQEGGVDIKLDLIAEAVDFFAFTLEGNLHYANLLKKSAADREIIARFKYNEEKYNRAQHFANMGSWEYSFSSDRLYWSRGCELLFGLEPGEFAGTFEAFISFVHPEDRDHVKAMNSPIFNLREGATLDYEHRIVRKDGSVRWVREEAGPLLDSSGNASSIVGVVIDITKQKEAEAALQETGKRLAGILESQQDMIVRIDRDGRFLYVNDSYCRKFGKNLEDLIGKSFTPLVHEEDVDETLKAMEKLYQPPYRAYMEQRAMTVEGWRWIAWEDSAILDENGRVVEIQGVGRDITDHKEALANLEASEARLTTLISQTPAVIYSYIISEKEPRITYVSENVKRVLGYEPASFFNNFSFWLKCLHPDDYWKVEQAWPVLFREGRVKLEPYRFKDASGNYRWLHDEQRLIVNQSGEREVFGSWWDISDRVELENKLIAGERRYRSVVEDQSELICRFSPDGVLTFVNEAYCRYFGKKAEQLIGSTFKPLIPEEDWGRVEENQAKINPANPVITSEYRVIAPGGQLRWQQWVERAIYDREGNLLEFQAVGRDISEQKRAEKALQEAHDRLDKRVKERTAELEATNKNLRREIAGRKKVETALASEKEFLNVTLKSIGDGVVIVDTDQNISLVNREAETITGFKEEEVLGRPLAGILRLQADENRKNIIKDPLTMIMAEENNKGDSQKILLTKDETRKIVFCKAVLISPHAGTKEPPGYVITIKDITELKKTEDRLALARKLEAIGKFTAGIAHEINTTLQYISDSTNFIKESCEEVKTLREKILHLLNNLDDKEPGAVMEKIREMAQEHELDYYLQEVPKAADEALEGIDRVNRLVDSLRSVSYSGAKGKGQVDVNRAILDTVNISRHEWKDIALVETDLEPELPAVHFNRDALVQVLLNLIVNAAHAVSDAVKAGKYQQGQISIKTSKQNDQVIVEVTDDGIGVSSDHIDQIFDPFFTSKEIGQGSGQGLMIVYDMIVNQYGGDINVQSERGSWTLFTISLPVRDQA